MIIWAIFYPWNLDYNKFLSSILSGHDILLIVNHLEIEEFSRELDSVYRRVREIRF